MSLAVLLLAMWCEGDDVGTVDGTWLKMAIYVGDVGLTLSYLEASCLITVDVDGPVTSANGTIRRLVHLFRATSSTRRPLCLIYIPTPNLVNLTLYPALYTLTTEMRDCLMSGRTWHLLDALESCGRPSSPCVDVIVSPYCGVTVIGSSISCLSVTCASRHRKWLLTQESRIAHSRVFWKFTLKTDRSLVGGGW
jgi:hypothetical protein